MKQGKTFEYVESLIKYFIASILINLLINAVL